MVANDDGSDVLLRRFWSLVDKTGACWVRGGSPKNGYSWVSGIGRGSSHIYAHRFSYEIHHGPIPSGLYVCHTCDNRRCVRPDHLFLGTHADNMADAFSKGRWPRRKLSEGDVRDIRRRVAAGENQRRIAERFAVDPALVWRINKGLAWAGRGLL